MPSGEPDRRSAARLIVRADANAAVGQGHFMRSLALAQAWAGTGGEVAWATTASETLIAPLCRAGWNVERLSDSSDSGFVRLLSEHPGAWVALDGYHFYPADHLRIRHAGHRLLVIDDLAHLERYDVEVLLNQNAHAGTLRYVTGPDTSTLFGTQYALLRSEFLAWKDHVREFTQPARRVLVTLGGSDRSNQTSKVIAALAEVQSGVDAVVVIGAANARADELVAAGLRTGGNVRVLVNPDSMAELMAWADLAVTAAGSTSWEVACMGLPSLVLTLTEDQRGVGAWLHRVGASRNLGWRDDIGADTIARAIDALIEDAHARARMSAVGRALVDGAGAARVVRALHAKASGSRAEAALALREATIDDCDLLWRWANDPITRASAFSTGPIPLDAHRRWLEARLADRSSYIFLGVEAGLGPVGQIRFDIDAEGADVDVHLDPARRARGLGCALIRRGLAALAERRQVARVRARIKVSNRASIGAFSRAGFEIVGSEDVAGHPVLVLVASTHDQSQRRVS